MDDPLQSALSVLKSDDAYAVSRARALLTVYHETWGVKWKTFEVIGVEHEFRFPLLNPETEAPSRTFDEAGKMDALLRHRGSGRLVVLEHKTTSANVTPDSRYWDRLRLDTQCSKYYLAAAQSDQMVDGVLYDVISKPGQRPCKVPTLDENGLKIVLDPQGQRVFNKTGKPRETADTEKGWVVQGRTETPNEFEARLLTILRESPGEFFAQREVPRLDSDILEYMADEWANSQQILYFRSRQLWPRNPDACDVPVCCEFSDLCCNRASIDGIRFRRRERIHAELNLQPGSKELLTNSRCKALRKCARYHQLRYEVGVEKVDEDQEALRFGTLMHLGLEHYFLFLQNNTPKTQ